MTHVAPIDVDRPEAAVLVDYENIRLGWEKRYDRSFLYSDLAFLCEQAARRFRTAVGRVVVFMSDPEACRPFTSDLQFGEISHTYALLLEDSQRPRAPAPAPPPPARAAAGRKAKIKVLEIDDFTDDEGAAAAAPAAAGAAKAAGAASAAEPAPAAGAPSAAAGGAPAAAAGACSDEEPGLIGGRRRRPASQINEALPTLDSGGSSSDVEELFGDLGGASPGGREGRKKSVSRVVGREEGGAAGERPKSPPAPPAEPAAPAAAAARDALASPTPGVGEAMPQCNRFNGGDATGGPGLENLSAISSARAAAPELPIRGPGPPRPGAVARAGSPGVFPGFPGVPAPGVGRARSEPEPSLSSSSEALGGGAESAGDASPVSTLEVAPAEPQAAVPAAAKPAAAAVLAAAESAAAAAVLAAAEPTAAPAAFSARPAAPAALSARSGAPAAPAPPAEAAVDLSAVRLWPGGRRRASGSSISSGGSSRGDAAADGDAGDAGSTISSSSSSSSGSGDGSSSRSGSGSRGLSSRGRGRSASSASSSIASLADDNEAVAEMSLISSDAEEAAAAAPASEGDAAGVPPKDGAETGGGGSGGAFSRQDSVGASVAPPARKRQKLAAESRLGLTACRGAEVMVKTFKYKRFKSQLVQRGCDVVIGSEVTKICFLPRFSSIFLFSADSDFEETTRACAEAEVIDGIVKYAKPILIFGFGASFEQKTRQVAYEQFRKRQHTRKKKQRFFGALYNFAQEAAAFCDRGVTVHLIECEFREEIESLLVGRQRTAQRHQQPPPAAQPAVQPAVPATGGGGGGFGGGERLQQQRRGSLPAVLPTPSFDVRLSNYFGGARAAGAAPAPASPSFSPSSPFPAPFPASAPFSAPFSASFSPAFPPPFSVYGGRMQSPLRPASAAGGGPGGLLPRPGPGGPAVASGALAPPPGNG